ncbi:MAG: hypothetical protein RLZZ511_2534 [Cyanobacteriota bacterium]
MLKQVLQVTISTNFIADHPKYAFISFEHTIWSLIMQRLASALAMGAIATASIATIVVGAQLQSNQCARISLPLDFNISLGKTCNANPAIAER